MSVTERAPARAGLSALVLLERQALALLLAVFVVLGAVYAAVTPLFEVSDEVWHYPMVKTLADGNGLPVQNPADPGPWRQQGSQPPLYYMVMALATAWIDTSDIDQVRWINPHADNGVITADRNNNIIIHTYRENWPWQGTTLAVRLVRLLSVLMGAGTVYFTYRLAQAVVPGRAGLALAAAGFVAFTPMFLFVSASVNNDNLAIVLSSAALWLMAAWVRGPAPASPRQAAAMGLLLGGAALSKVSALGLWPLAGAALLFSWLRVTGVLQRTLHSRNGHREPGSLRVGWLIARGGLVFVTALALSGWWFWRNVRLYGDWLGWSAFLDTVGRRPHPATLAQLWGERVGFVQAYWGLFGGVSVPMPNWAYLALNLALAAAAVGMAWVAMRGLARRRPALPDVALWGLLAAWLVLIVVGLVRWTSLTWASQGRLIFPAISALAVLAVYGLAALWRGLPAVVVGFMALLSAAVPFAVIRPHYLPPPTLSEAQTAAIPNRLDADFGGEMRLLGYELETAAVQPGDAVRLRLYWQALSAMDRNWSIFVHLVDEAGVIVAQRDRYPGMGALATTLLQPSQTFADEYVIPVPEAAYAPAELRVVVGLYDLLDGARLPLAAADGTDALELARLALAARDPVSFPGIGAVPNPVRQNFGNRVELVGYDLDRRAVRPGETLRLTLYWRALRRLETNYSVFAHVRGEAQMLWAGQDSWPQQGAAPTSAWREGEVISDPYELTLKPDTPPGQYAIEVGLYDPEVVRLQVIADDGRPTDADYVDLSSIRVVAP